MAPTVDSYPLIRLTTWKRLALKVFASLPARITLVSRCCCYRVGDANSDVFHSSCLGRDNSQRRRDGWTSEWSIKESNHFLWHFFYSEQRNVLAPVRWVAPIACVPPLFPFWPFFLFDRLYHFSDTPTKIRNTVDYSKNNFGWDNSRIVTTQKEAILYIEMCKWLLFYPLSSRPSPCS